MRNRLDRRTIARLKNERQKGKTVTVLMKEFNLPKTTVWHHISDVILSKEAYGSINENRGGSRRRKEVAIEKAKITAEELLKSNKRDLVIITAMLYWAEGHKNDFVFTNSDASMVRLYITFLREVLYIDVCNIHILIRISDPILPEEAIRYWSHQLSLPVTCFKINHDNVQNKTKTRNGIARVIVRKSGFYLKIMQRLIDSVKQS